MRANQNPGRWRSAARGFSLLEVIAAMVIFSAGATVLFSWIGQTATRLRTVGSEQRQLFGQLAALEFARTLNPMLRPSGELAMEVCRRGPGIASQNVDRCGWPVCGAAVPDRAGG